MVFGIKNFLWIFPLSILVLVSFLFVFVSAEPQEDVTYTPSSKTSCIDGVCNKILYSGVMFVYEDEVWKDIEDAKSLKDSWLKVYLEKDLDFDIEIDYVNFTDLGLNFTFNYLSWEEYPECSGNWDDIKCDFKLTIKEEVCNETDCWKESTKFQYKYQRKNGVVKDNLKYVLKGNPLKYEYTFGGNSTTIILQDADTENLGDSYVIQSVPDGNYGSDTQIKIRNDTLFNAGYISFNTSGLSEIGLISAFVFLYQERELGATYEQNTSFGNIFEGNSFDEDVITFNNQVCGNIYNMSEFNHTICNNQTFGFNYVIAEFAQFWDFDITPIFNKSLSENSFYFKTDGYSGGYGLYYSSKESATPSQRPYLNITYYGDVVVNILNGTTANPINVTYPQNTTLTFIITEEGVNITSGVSMNNVIIGGVSAPILTSLVDLGIWYIRTDDNGVSDSSGLETVSFSSMPNTDYSALATSLTDSDVVYSLKQYNKATGGNDWWLEDDAGSNEIANFMYGVIQHGHVSVYSKHIECGSESGSSSNSWEANFETNFPSTSYSAICNPNTDTDSPICIQNDVIGKAVDSITFFLNDDYGNAEYVSGIDWCIFEHGEYEMGEVTIKAGQNTQTSSVLTGTFSTNFPNTNYVVFITDATSYTESGCSCEVTNRAVGSFTARCEDDGDSDTDCNSESFDWVAIEQGDFDSSLMDVIDQFSWVDGVGWQVNVSVPDFEDGLKDLFINVSDGIGNYDDTETNAINYGEAPSDSCTCTNGANWEIDMEDFCVHSDACTPLAVTFINTGNFTCNALLNATSIEGLSSGQIGYVKSSCIIIDR